jgi:hypothetical protein
MKNKNSIRNSLRRLLVLSTLCLSILSLSPLVSAQDSGPFFPYVLPPGYAMDSVSDVDEITGNVTISGRLDPNKNYVSMDINGYPATLTYSSGPVGAPVLTFDLVLPASSDYQVNLYDANSNSVVVNYSAPDAIIDSAVQVVVADHFLTDVGPALSALLMDLDLTDVLNIDANECVIDTWWLIGCDFYLDELGLNGTPTINISFTPTDGSELTVNIDMEIPESVIATRIKKSFWWGYHDTTITTSDISVSLQIGLAATDDQSVKFILDEPSDVHISFGHMDVDSNSLAAHLIPLFKDAAALIINNHVVNIAGPYLAGLDIPRIPINLPIDIDGDGNNDAEFAINMGVELLDVLAGGDGVAQLGGSITSAAVAPGNNTLGVRRIGGMLPTASEVISPTDLQTSIAVDYVNQLLLAVYQSGIEESLAISLKVADLGSVGEILALVGYGPDTVINIAMNLNNQPEIIVNGDSEFPLGLLASIANLDIVMSTQKDGVEEVLLDMTADALLKTSIGAEGDGKLDIELDELVAVNVPTVHGGVLVDLLGDPLAVAISIWQQLPGLMDQLEPIIEELADSARIELDMGEVLGEWLDATFPSVPVAGYITDTGVSDDNTYMNIGIGIDFP